MFQTALSNLTLAGFSCSPSKPPIKHAEEILYFVFCTLDPILAQQTFLNCWPIYDRNQSREFRLHVFKWLQDLKKQGELPPDCLLRKSIIDECKGDRFEMIIYYLSQLLLQKKIKCPIGTFRHLKPTAQAFALQISISKYQKEYYNLIKKRDSYLTESKTIFTYLNTQQSQLVQQYDELSKLFVLDDETRNDLLKKRQDLFFKIDQLWKSITFKISRLKNKLKHDGTLDCLSNKFEKQVIDGKNLTLKLPCDPEITNEFEDYMTLNDINPYLNGKLDLCALFKLYLYSLSRNEASIRNENAILLKCVSENTIHNHLEKENEILASFSKYNQEFKKRSDQLQEIIKNGQKMVKHSESLDIFQCFRQKLPSYSINLEIDHVDENDLINLDDLKKEILECSLEIFPDKKEKSPEKVFSKTSAEPIYSPTKEQKTLPRLIKQSSPLQKLLAESLTRNQKERSKSVSCGIDKKELSRKIAEELRKKTNTPKKITKKDMETPIKLFSNMNMNMDAFDSPCVNIQDDETFDDLIDENFPSFFVE